LRSGGTYRSPEAGTCGERTRRDSIALFAAVAGYAVHGWRRDTTNQFHPPARGTQPFMLTLIVAEIGGWLVLAAGFLDSQVF